MSPNSGRDWGKERWRKQYVREPLQQRAWPVMARGLRELLNALAEDDGSLVRDMDDPVEALLRALNPQEYEVELVEAAIQLLLRDGLLARDERSLWMPELPRSQAQREAASGTPAQTTSAAPRSTSAPTSTERVRQFRERQRNAAGVSSSVTSPPTASVTSVSGAVSLRVSATDQQDLFLGLDCEKDREKDHLPQKRERATPSVSFDVSSAVSAERVSLPGVSNMDEEEDSNVPRNLKEALVLPAAGRAELLRRRPELGRRLAPDCWPEVAAIAAAFAEGAGLPKLYLGAYDKDEGVRRVVELLAAGFPQNGLEYVARTVPKQPWWSSGGKRLGLSSLSPEVVRRNLPSEDGRPRTLSPRLAKIIEAARQERKADGAA
jgi:hypothetical protein